MLCKHSRRIGRKLRHKSDERRRYHMEDGTARSSWTAYARGGREQGVHLLETCSLYPLLIERSALGSTGVDWTHQQPLTIAPSRRLPPCLIYVRICMCVCVCVCARARARARVRVCVYIYMYAHMRRENSAAKRRPKTLRSGEDGHPGGGSYDFNVYLEEGLSPCECPTLVCVLARTKPYWTLDIERR